jgi:hypothetical protein
MLIVYDNWSAGRNKPPLVREITRRPRQLLAANETLTSWGSWWILQPIWILLSKPSPEISRPAIVAAYGGSLNSSAAVRVGYFGLILVFVVAVGLFSFLVRRNRQERSSWPTWLLVPIVIVLALPMGVAMPDPLGSFRFLVFAIVLSRWMVALVRRERGHGWMFYIPLLVAVQLFIYPVASAFASK